MHNGNEYIWFRMDFKKRNFISSIPVFSFSSF